jgi:hypothetical protein
MTCKDFENDMQRCTEVCVLLDSQEAAYKRGTFLFEYCKKQLI